MGATGTKCKELATSGLAGFSAASLRAQAHALHSLSRGKVLLLTLTRCAITLRVPKSVRKFQCCQTFTKQILRCTPVDKCLQSHLERMPKPASHPGVHRQFSFLSLSRFCCSGDETGTHAHWVRTTQGSTFLTQVMFRVCPVHCSCNLDDVWRWLSALHQLPCISPWSF